MAFYSKSFQEIGLIDNLINMGNFSKTEVSRVLRILFPDKTKQEVKSLVKNVYANANVSQQNGDLKYCNFIKRFETS